MRSSIARLICRRGAGGGRLNGGRMMSTTTTNPSKISPWLMLPPTFDKRRGGMVYNFYNLADNEVLLFNKYGGGADPIESPDDDARVVGSSHGWLALMNRRNNDLYLSNPLSRRHIKLPPIDALPHPEFNLRRHRGRVSKVILSSSPDDGAADCRAVMSFGPCDRLAFCRPAIGESVWAPLGIMYLRKDGDGYARVYEDFVHSSSSNLLNCLVITEDNDFTLEDWDLRSAPTIHWVQTEQPPAMKAVLGQTMPVIDGFGDGEKDEELRRCGWRILKHLVFVEQRDELLMLLRFMDGGRTLGFVAAKVEKQKAGKMRLVRSSLEGLSVFVGTSHSFVLSAADFPHLKPNSIYFTDNKAIYTPPFDYRDSITDDFEGGIDAGIFDYGEGTMSSIPSHQATDDKTPHPPPIWFTPSFV